MCSLGFRFLAGLRNIVSCVWLQWFLWVLGLTGLGAVRLVFYGGFGGGGVVLERCVSWFFVGCGGMCS